MNRSYWVSGTVFSVFVLATTTVMNFPTKLIYNASESAPVGFYWVDNQAASRGDYVAVRVPKSVRNLVEERGYLDSGVPLIKRIVGINGDEICRRSQDILLNGVAVAVARLKDELRRELPIWQGCITLQANDFLLLQDHPASFDGRYFGPVDRSIIIGRATRLCFRCRTKKEN